MTQDPQRAPGHAHDDQVMAWQLAATQEVLRVSQERYRIAFQTSLDAIAICRMDDGMFVDVNRSFFEILGYERDELVGQTSAEVYVWVDEEGKDQRKEFVDVSGRTLRELEIWHHPGDWDTLMHTLQTQCVCRDFEAWLRKRDGTLIWGRISASLIELEGVLCVLFVIRDTTAAKRAEEKIRTLSHYDSLTGLPNREFLLEKLHSILSTWVEKQRVQALLIFDLDEFNLLNDAFGHRVGDLLLQATAQRIFGCIRDGDIVARLSGDEFGVLLEDLGDNAEEAARQAQLIAQRVLMGIAQPYTLENREYRCTASVGITLIDGAGRAVEEIVREADLATSRASSAGRSSLRFFEPCLQEAVSTRVTMEEELRLAIDRGEFFLCYQPQIKGARVVGAEALIRWRHPMRGLVPPDEFIPLAEETGLILPLGDWVLETACRQISNWSRSRDLSGVTIAVNVSARQIHQPNFAEKVLSILKNTGIAPRQLEIELTETSLVNDIEGVIKTMRVLKEHGLRFSVDDFGVGYSSLSYLKRLPLDKLKIDRAFVRDILVEPSSSAIAQAIISICHAMNLSVVAEGVETEAQRERLAQLGCHTFQGFLFSKPLPGPDFELLLAEGAPAEGSRLVEQDKRFGGH